MELRFWEIEKKLLEDPGKLKNREGITTSALLGGVLAGAMCGSPIEKKKIMRGY